jgi:tRNA pseudouridine13 synthase
MYSFDWSKAYPVVPGIAQFKSAPEDFIVEETLSFELTGEGEHLYFYIEKASLSTTYVADQLARWAGVGGRDVSFAGLKDRQSVSRQWFSVWMPGKPLPELPFDLPNTSVLVMKKHDKKLRRGAIRENRFCILLRQVSADKTEIEKRLALISAEGVPNYFGPQRFGHQGANIPDALQVLSRRKLNRERKSMLISAVRSYLFNASLDHLVRDGSWKQVVNGQPLQLSGTKSWFLAEDSESEADRVVTGDCSPTCSLYAGSQGRDYVPPTASEQQVYEQFPELTSLLDKERLDHARRATILRVSGLIFEWQGDDLKIEFGLPTGTYATGVLSELIAVNEA